MNKRGSSVVQLSNCLHAGANKDRHATWHAWASFFCLQPSTINHLDFHFEMKISGYGMWQRGDEKRGRQRWFITSVLHTSPNTTKQTANCGRVRNRRSKTEGIYTDDRYGTGYITSRRETIIQCTLMASQNSRTPGRQGQAAAGESEAAAKNGYRAKSFGQWPGARWVTRSKTKKKRPVPTEAVELSTVSAPTVIELPNASSDSPSKSESESESRCCG